jgi:hypothetical protein
LSPGANASGATGQASPRRRRVSPSATLGHASHSGVTRNRFLRPCVQLTLRPTATRWKTGAWRQCHELTCTVRRESPHARSDPVPRFARPGDRTPVPNRYLECASLQPSQ